MLDWNKPIECDAGEIKLCGMHAQSGAWVEMADLRYKVSDNNGKPLSPHINIKTFTVRNKQSRVDRAITTIVTMTDVDHIKAALIAKTLNEAGHLKDD